jgi:hypothetical protein
MEQAMIGEHIEALLPSSRCSTTTAILAARQTPLSQLAAA